MKILGIETSCDETSAAIVERVSGRSSVKLLTNIVATSLTLHAKTGGIIPEVAARQQVEYIIPVVKKALVEANLYPRSSKIELLSSTFYRPEVDAIAVTVGPGLIGSLLVGVETAKTLSLIWNKPLIPVNHLIGHIYANWIRTIDHEPSTINFPAIALLVSGGHTDLLLMKSHGNIKWLGGTRDDAAGEAFDKIGRLLHLPYPGGPAIEKAAQKGDPKRFSFPRPMMQNPYFSAKDGPASGWDFSFSGLKSAVFREVQKTKKLDKQTIADMSRGVLDAIVDVLVSKTVKAASRYNAQSILLGGGVAANQKLTDQLQLSATHHRLNARIFVPQKSLCTDNAAMIATAGFFNYNVVDWKNISANPELYFDTAVS